MIDVVAGPRMSRADYLLKTFGEEISFMYRKKRHLFRFYFVAPDSPVIAAVIGRQQKSTITPNEDFKSEEVTDWETANVFIDTSGDERGQRAAMQKTPHMRSPLEIFRALADFVNRRSPDTDWTLAVNPESQTAEFWKAVERYKGSLTELDLVYYPPNVWGGFSETEKALKALGAQTNTDEVDVKIKNADGNLDLSGEIVRESVSYVTKGAGKAVLKVGNRKVFDTDSAVATESPEEDVEVENSPLDQIIRLIRRLLGR